MAYGIMLALWVREKTGRGSKVESSLLQTAIAMQSVDLVRADDDPSPEPAAANPSYGAYLCGDGAYINVTALSDQQFGRILEVLELKYLEDDPRWHDAYQKAAYRQGIYPIVQEFFLTKTSAEWLEALRKADVPSAILALLGV